MTALHLTGLLESLHADLEETQTLRRKALEIYVSPLASLLIGALTLTLLVCN